MWRHLRYQLTCALFFGGKKIGGELSNLLGDLDGLKDNRGGYVMNSRVSGEGESALNFLLRATATQNIENTCGNRRNLDPPLITDYGLIVIDWSKNDIISINRYIYRLCSLVWSQFDGSKELHNSISQQNLVKNRPNIILFDGLNAIDVTQFNSYLPHSNIAKKIFICKEPNQLKLLGTIVC